MLIELKEYIKYINENTITLWWQAWHPDNKYKMASQGEHIWAIHEYTECSFTWLTSTWFL